VSSLPEKTETSCNKSAEETNSLSVHTGSSNLLEEQCSSDSEDESVSSDHDSHMDTGCPTKDYTGSVDADNDNVASKSALPKSTKAPPDEDLPSDEEGQDNKKATIAFLTELGLTKAAEQVGIRDLRVDLCIESHPEVYAPPFLKDTIRELKTMLESVTYSEHQHMILYELRHRRMYTMALRIAKYFKEKNI